MKAISASIVVLAGAGCFSAGAFVRHNQTSATGMLLGAGLGLIGLAAWARSMMRPNE